jgi:hypothetical protein
MRSECFNDEIQPRFDVNVSSDDGAQWVLCTQSIEELIIGSRSRRHFGVA